jgi:PKD repeat protein
MGVNNRGYRFHVYSDGKPGFIVSPDGQYSTAYHLTADTALSAGTWHHLAAVFDAEAQTLAIYVDGAPAGSLSVSYDQVYPSTAPFMLGANLDSGSTVQHFDGTLDGWRVYARALSQVEVGQLMDAPGAGFAAAPRDGFAPLVVTFTNQSANATAYGWDFGDGATSAQVNPVHTYAQPGAYTVTLHASDGAVTGTLVRPAYVEATGLDYGLRGYWRLDEGSGTRYDASASGNDLTDYNTVGSATGIVGLAADFERDNGEYLSIDHGVQSGLAITGSLTLAGWIKPEVTNQYVVLASKYEYGVNNRGYRFHVYSDGKPGFIVSPNGTYDAAYHLAGDTALSAGT